MEPHISSLYLRPHKLQRALLELLSDFLASRECDLRIFVALEIIEGNLLAIIVRMIDSRNREKSENNL